MRTLSLAYYVSVDGKSADADNGIRDVMTGIQDEEQEAYFVEHLWDAGTFIMGRTSYEAMAPFWPTSDHPSAHAMNTIEKVVFSRSPISTDAWPARVAAGDTAAEIAALKAEPGKKIVAAGGTTFQHALIRLGVVDEYRLWVLPAVTGRGAPLFPELDAVVPLRLTSHRAFPSGVLELVYEPA